MTSVDDLGVLVRQLQGRFGGGVATLTWPGGTTFSDVTNVPLKGAPSSVQGTADLPPGQFAFEVAFQDFDATGVRFRGHTTDGSTPAAGTTRSFAWTVVI